MTPLEVEPQTWRLSGLPRLIERVAGFPEIVAALEAGHAATIDGAWGSSCALVAAALAARVPRTLFVVTAHVADVADLADDLATLSGRGVERFPAWESLPRDEPIVDEIYGQRLQLLKLLASDAPPKLIVTSIQALLQPVPSRGWIERHSRL